MLIDLNEFDKKTLSSRDIEIYERLRSIGDSLLVLDLKVRCSPRIDGLMVTINDMLIVPGSKDHAFDFLVIEPSLSKIGMKIKLSDLTDQMFKEMVKSVVLYLALDCKLKSDRKRFGVDNINVIKREHYFNNQFSTALRKFGLLKIIAGQYGVAI